MRGETEEGGAGGEEAQLPPLKETLDLKSLVREVYNLKSFTIGGV